ncbi:MAG: DUF1552 domain-containing protein [Verrucomicrobiales bacterium]
MRGLGTCIALPAFESLLPTSHLAAAEDVARRLATTATGAPLRSAFVFFPNGAIPKHWWPEGGPSDFTLNQTLQPLEQIRQKVQIMRGLDHKNAEGGKDGGGDHARGNGVFLTGVRWNKNATDVQCGISIDQVIANQVGHLTHLPSLEVTCDQNRQSSGCDSGYSCAYLYNISWRSNTTPMTPESNPRLVFERLFGAGKHAERAANTQRRIQDRPSVLDFVLGSAKDMQRRLGVDDQGKLDQYLTSVRDIEKRIEKSEEFEPLDPEVATPAGIPTSQMEYVNLMYDRMLLAFQTDTTRVATFVLGHDGDNRSFSEIGIPEGHHDLSHHQKKEERVEKVAQIDQWYVQQFAKFLDKLDQTKDIDGHSILHNSMIVYGSGNADSNRHTHDDLPVVLAGGGGGLLTPSRYMQHSSQPMSNMFLSLADRMGVQSLERFGDSTARLANV